MGMPTQSPSSGLPTLSSARTGVHSPERSTCAAAGALIIAKTMQLATTDQRCFIASRPVEGGSSDPLKPAANSLSGRPLRPGGRVYCAGSDSQSLIWHTMGLLPWPAVAALAAKAAGGPGVHDDPTGGQDDQHRRASREQSDRPASYPRFRALHDLAH